MEEKPNMEVMEKRERAEVREELRMVEARG